MAADNPFNPGAGRRPPLLTGRDDLIEAVHGEMDRTLYQGGSARPWIIWGLRGIGKTVLLNEFAGHARSEGWIVILTEATSRESIAQRISQAAYLELRRLRGKLGRLSDALKHALGVLKSFQLAIDPSGSYSIGIDIEPAVGYADSGNLSLDLQDVFRALGEAAVESGTAVFVGIDELQEGGQGDLDALNVALHALGRGIDQIPLFFCGTGLPTLPSVLAEATSYAERMYRYYRLGLLTDEASRLALSEPCEELGVRWDEEALDYIVGDSDGYPYFVQSCGFFAWDVRTEADLISEDDARIAVKLAQEEVDNGLYRSRWDRATDKQRKFMAAMACDDGPSTMEDLVKRMGKSRQSDLSSVRANLIDSGLIYAPRTGQVAFTVPGMNRYIRRQLQDA